MAAASRGVLSQKLYIPKHICKCSNLRLYELHTKLVVRSQAAYEVGVIRVRHVLLVEK
jgi:hypothetical protein